MKRIIKDNTQMLIGFIIGAIVFTGLSSLVAYALNASEVSFTPTDSDWKVNDITVGDVKTALDSLYTKSNNVIAARDAKISFYDFVYNKLINGLKIEFIGAGFNEFFTLYDAKDGTGSELYICIKKDSHNRFACLKGDDASEYDNNKELLTNVFGSTNCATMTGANVGIYRCNNTNNWSHFCYLYPDKEHILCGDNNYYISLRADARIEISYSS